MKKCAKWWLFLWGIVVVVGTLSACSSAEWKEQACPLSVSTSESESSYSLEEMKSKFALVVWQALEQEMLKKNSDSQCVSLENEKLYSNEHSQIKKNYNNEQVVLSCIDINADNMERLMNLPGVGKKRAMAIIERREKNRFRTKKDIIKIKGIGHKAYQKIAPMICDIH